MEPLSPLFVLARASTDDPLNVNALLVLVSAGVVVAVAVLAAVPALVAGRRRHRDREAIVAFVICWALGTAAAVVWAVDRNWAASAERQRQVESGDYDPHDLPPEPATPWGWWCGVAAAYAGLVAWAAVGRASATGRPGGG